jgi:hypothetical protein
MYFELLSLEIHASMSGLNVIKPPYSKGKSGVDHRFSFLASDDRLEYGFDIYEDTTQEEVLKTYTKKLDTEVCTFIVNLRGRPREESATLANEYGITILGPAEIDSFFNWMKVGVEENIKGSSPPIGVSS